MSSPITCSKRASRSAPPHEIRMALLPRRRRACPLRLHRSLHLRRRAQRLRSRLPARASALSSCRSAHLHDPVRRGGEPQPMQDRHDELGQRGIRSGGSSALRRRGGRRSGSPFVILRPNWFMDNFHTLWLEPIRQSGVIPFPPATPAPHSSIPGMSQRRRPLRSRSDHLNGNTFTLTGPQALTYAEAASVLSKVSGRAIQYVPLEDEPFTPIAPRRRSSSRSRRVHHRPVRPYPRGSSGRNYIGRGKVDRTAAQNVQPVCPG